MTIRQLIYVLLLATLAAGCGGAARVLRPTPVAAVDTVRATQLAYPIIFLHGLGQKAHVWDKEAVTYYEKELGLNFGGRLLTKGGKSIIENKAPKPTADFFTVTFASHEDSVSAWVEELRRHIATVQSRTGAQKVILIGYSMGGLTGRAYLVKYAAAHNVVRLVTIGSPHQGSAYAKVWNWKTALLRVLNSDPNFAQKAVVKTALSAFEAVEDGVRADAPAVRDLRRPSDGGTFLRDLNSRPHPLDVEYVSVVGNVQMGGMNALSASATQEVLRRLLGVVGMGAESLFEPGDGVVSASSQDMSELPWFTGDTRRRRLARTVKITTVHEDHLRKSTDIQHVTLQDEPSFLGADFAVSPSGQLGLMVDVGDYLPARWLDIEVKFVSASGVVRAVKADSGRIPLVRAGDGSVFARAWVAVPADLSPFESVRASITIKNHFGNVATAQKTWLPPSE